LHSIIFNKLILRDPRVETASSFFSSELFLLGDPEKLGDLGGDVVLAAAAGVFLVFAILFL